MYENTWKCGELMLYFSPSDGGYIKKNLIEYVSQAHVREKTVILIGSYQFKPFNVFRHRSRRYNDNVYTGGGCTQLVHGRSRMTIDPRIPTAPGRETSGFHQPQTLLAPSARRRAVFGELHKG